jgi:hypothetical protein
MSWHKEQYTAFWEKYQRVIIPVLAFAVGYIIAKL